MRKRGMRVVLLAALVIGAGSVPAADDPDPAVRDRVFLAVFTPGPAWIEDKPLTEQGLSEHGGFWLREYAAGRMLQAGPFTDDSGGAVIFRADDLEAAQALVARDPAVVEGKMVATVSPWRWNEWDYYLRRQRPADAVDGPWRSDNVLSAEGRKPLSGKVEELAWLVGHWVGEGLGGRAEYHFAPLSAGTLAGTFQHARNDQVRFYEIVVIAEQNGRTAVRIKHFDPDLSGWEAAGEWIEFPLLELVPGRAAYFDGLTYRLDDDGTLHAFVISGNEDPARELSFHFRRQ